MTEPLKILLVEDDELLCLLLRRLLERAGHSVSVAGDGRQGAGDRLRIDAREADQVCPILFSPVQGELPPAQLAEWVLADRLPVRMQVQLHKILWGNTPGR